MFFICMTAAVKANFLSDNTVIRLIVQVFASVLFFLSMSVNATAPIDIATLKYQTLGQNFDYFQEQKDLKLELSQAMTHFDSHPVKQGSGNSISLGIGVRPVWLKASISNPNNRKELFRLSVETPWLDDIDTYIVKNGKTIKHVSGGDAVPYLLRPMQYRYYAFETQFPSGQSELYIRINSLGPMAIPVRLSTVPLAINRDIRTGYEYGILYGIMLALALYNFVLYTNIKQKEFGLYSLYLLGFVANSLSYTGQIHTVITPDLGPYFQDWLDIFLMITYSVFGLHFARFALDTKSYAPKLNKVTFWIATVIPIGMLLGAIVNQLVFSMILAFILNSSFAVLFVILGYQAYKHNVPSAILFFVSSVTAATCIGISTMAVAGLVPYNDFTFKAIEVGMTFEAILLALLLAQRFHSAQKDKVIAETLARTDDLTHLLNRHGFKAITKEAWRDMLYENQDCSVILLDIDRFSDINDEFGHATGDLVLMNVAKCLSSTIREGDILARWRGEEFILFLPKTNQLHAILLAEDIRQAIEINSIPYGGEMLTITASVGVAGSNLKHFDGVSIKQIDLAHLIDSANNALYQAQTAGRNQVFASHLAPQY